MAGLQDGLAWLRATYPSLLERGADPACQLGTLGGGNHFIEVCLDERQRVWLMLHSGSRGIGNRIGTHFIARAKQEMGHRIGTLPDKDLAYLSEGMPVFADYVRAVGWAQQYAATNRTLMMTRVREAVAGALRRLIELDGTAVNCHHNYVQREHHFNRTVWLTRKGAVYAGRGALGIIPGSMGARSYIVEGLGNPDSFESCSHGAGRRMSRGAAKRTITLEAHAAATAGIECRKDAAVLDESPAAYKDIDAVMAAQRDLVRPVHVLKQVLCVKG
jgi:tRNA-splicing ligase RtcB (3'-phosphate/5'-hydroxy nucleic acid ligase)